MANTIDTYSYGLGFEHGCAWAEEVVRDVAYDLALIEDSFREVQAGRKSTVEMYFEMRTVFRV